MFRHSTISLMESSEIIRGWPNDSNIAVTKYIRVITTTITVMARLYGFKRSTATYSLNENQPIMVDKRHQKHLSVPEDMAV